MTQNYNITAIFLCQLLKDKLRKYHILKLDKISAEKRKSQGSPLGFV
jgi:hypothetical protein